MSIAWLNSLTGAVDHLLIAPGLGLLFLLIVALGGIHVCRIFGTLLLEIAREFKRELRGMGKVLGKLRHELGTWKEDE
jgi:hypothetical protein